MSFALTKSCQGQCFWCKAVTKVESRDQPLYAVGVMGGGMGRSAFSPIIADSVARRSAQGVAGG